MILGDKDIQTYLELQKLKVVSSYNKLSIQQNGLDCRIGDTIAVDIKVGTVEKPKEERQFSGDIYRDFIIDTHNKESINRRFNVYNFDTTIIQPKTNILLVTEEYFEFPDDLMAFCGLRSSVARMGFTAPITIVDAGFKGTLTIELFWGGNNPVKIYKGDRFLHVIFAKTNSPVQFPYNGFYTGQKQVNLPKSLGD